ncbi:MAG TPA: hypothetical protein PLZ86_07255 [bacterium]|nr:hypothetical protein [bacterium]
MTEDIGKTLESQDPKAAALYALLRDEMGVKGNDIDSGVPFIDCDANSCRRGIKPGTAKNGFVEPGEVYEAAIALLEKEEDSFAASEGKAQRPFTDLVSTKSNFRVPWLFNDFDTGTDADDRMLLSAARMVSGAKAAILSRGEASGSAKFNLELTKKLVSTMLSKDGFGLKPDSPEPPEDTVMDMLSLPPGMRNGACTELSRFAYGVFRLAGLKPSFIEVQRDSINGGFNHMAVGVRLNAKDPEKITTVDMLHGGWISHEGHELWAEMPAVTSMAAYFTNRAHYEITAAKPKTPARIEEVDRLFKEALRLDPSFSLAHYNRSIFLSEWRRDRRGAYEEASEAVRIRPFERIYLKLQKEQKPAEEPPLRGRAK